jgi:deazaflavin-dependent oxidoreductase (nitroreductase family)
MEYRCRDRPTVDARRKREPLAAHLHFIPRTLARFQAAIVSLFRRTLERSPNWILLITRGRRTGLPREVLLPCIRTDSTVIVISTYGWRSDWIRNIRKTPEVLVTRGGRQLPGRAEAVEDLLRKRQLVTEHPFFPPAPSAFLNRLLRPVLVPLLRRWVTPRPVVVIHCP